MIKKMTKYSFVIYHKEVDAFLNSLQTLGLVDVTRSSKAVDDTSKELFGLLGRYSSTIKALKAISSESARSDNPMDAGELLKNAEEAIKNRTLLQNELAAAKNDYMNSTQWGNFNVSDISRIEQMGLTPHFYSCSKKLFKKEWEENHPITILNETADKIYFVRLESKGEASSFTLAESQFPQHSPDEYSSRIDAIKSDILENEKKLELYAGHAAVLENEKRSIEDNLDKYLAAADAAKEADNCIVLFEGFAPTENDAEIEEQLDRENVYYIKESATQEDNPPISLKNNWFSRLFEPIGSLYMLPKYGETDLTPYFAPFYMLFFGLCLGDMGYGLVLLVSGIYVTFKMPAARAYGKLIAWLGLGSIIMPALNGTFFGAKIYELFHFPESWSAHFFTDMKMFWFAIIFGIVQIVFARILNAIFAMKAKGFFAGLHNIGWALLISWLSIWYSSTQVPFEMPSVITYLGYLGLALIILFTSDNRNIFVKLFKGVSALYDITSVFGDMLSYIRLFGLGTAGGILGMVVNSVAMQLGGIPYVGWLFMLLMLVIGHIMVLLLSSLGAFVHPMRLTFVEFYKNAGFEGGGREYRPLKNSKENK